MNRPGNKRRRPQLLYIIGCEGANQERLYFEKIQEIVNNIEERTYDLLFDFAEPFGGDPKCVVERAVKKSIGKMNKAAVFDYDGKREKYEEAIDLAMDKQITLGYTNYCFDLWLILHKEDHYDRVNSSDGYIEELRKVYGLENNANVKKRDQVKAILDKIDLEDIKAAVRRAEVITASNLEKESNKTPQSYEYYDNPDTQMHEMLKDVFSKIGIEKNLIMMM